MVALANPLVDLRMTRRCTENGERDRELLGHRADEALTISYARVRLWLPSLIVQDAMTLVQ